MCIVFEAGFPSTRISLAVRCHRCAELQFTGCDSSAQGVLTSPALPTAQQTVTKTMDRRYALMNYLERSVLTSFNPSMNAEQPVGGEANAQAVEPAHQKSAPSPIASCSSSTRGASSSGTVDLRPHMGRKQAWDAWRPGPYGAPTPPSMEKRLAEESALEMAAMMGHGRQDGRARKIRPRRTVDVGGSMSRWTLVHRFF